MARRPAHAERAERAEYDVRPQSSRRAAASLPLANDILKNQLTIRSINISCVTLIGKTFAYGKTN